VYSVKEDIKQKIFLTLRTTLPVVVLMVLLAFVAFMENRSLLFNIFIFVMGIFASIYFIFYMFFSNVREKVIDDITLAFNRKYFLNFLKKQKGKLLVLISIDNIQEINERYGIENGDKILKEFAKIIDRFFFEKLGKEVPIGRLKGGEFLVLLDGDEDRLKPVLDEFLKRYDNTFIDNIEIKISYAISKIDSDNVKAIIDRLYEELYYCKEECKENRLSKKKRENGDFDTVIREIIEKEKINLLFQPTLNVKSGKFDLVEIIVKLVDGDGSLIHPSQYIPVINRLGLENEFDLVVAKKLIKTILEYKLPLNIFYTFNISPYSIRNRNFYQSFLEIFKQSNVDKSRFVIELFENKIYKDIKFYKKILQRYKSEGFKLAFDNFGACNASIEYIKEIDVDFVHFDKFFTKNIDNMKYRLLLISWVGLFKKLGIKSVIKFIDDEQKKELFISLGVDYIQGFAIARPMERDEFKEFIKDKI